jgi:hypothetical protein
MRLRAGKPAQCRYSVDGEWCYVLGASAVEADAGVVAVGGGVVGVGGGAEAVVTVAAVTFSA